MPALLLAMPASGALNSSVTPARYVDSQQRLISELSLVMSCYTGISFCQTSWHLSSQSARS